MRLLYAMSRGLVSYVMMMVQSGAQVDAAPGNIDYTQLSIDGQPGYGGDQSTRPGSNPPSVVSFMAGLTLGS